MLVQALPLGADSCRGITLADRAGMLVSPRQARITGADFQREPACAGPFRLTRRVAQDRMELERFSDYWDRAAIHAERVTYRPVTDGTVRLANLRAGALDVIERISPSDVAEARRDRRVRLVEAPSLASFYIAINVPDNILYIIFSVVYQRIFICYVLIPIWRCQVIN